MSGERLRGLPPISHHATDPLESADGAGLEAACKEHGGALYGHARRRLGEAGLAEEAVAETFVRAWRSRRRFDPSLGTLRGWLFDIERGVIIDLGRDRTPRAAVADDPVADDPVGRIGASWHVKDAIRRLSPEHREVLVEFHYRGRRSAEVAMSLGIPEGTVRSRLFHALKGLRALIDETGWEPVDAEQTRPAPWRGTAPACR